MLLSRNTQQLSERSRTRGILETFMRGFLSLVVDAEEKLTVAELKAVTHKLA